MSRRGEPKRRSSRTTVNPLRPGLVDVKYRNLRRQREYLPAVLLGDLPSRQRGLRAARSSEPNLREAPPCHLLVFLWHVGDFLLR